MKPETEIKNNIDVEIERYSTMLKSIADRIRAIEIERDELMKKGLRLEGIIEYLKMQKDKETAVQPTSNDTSKSI